MPTRKSARFVEFAEASHERMLDGHEEGSQLRDAQKRVRIQSLEYVSIKFEKSEGSKS